MDVYFVRHGETNGNIAKRYQHPNTPLNETGKAQARAISDTIGAFKPTYAITSTQLRAIETARLILPSSIIPETHADFEELRRPLNLVGERYLGFTTLAYILKWFFNLSQNEGETYREFLERIKRARAHLESLPSDARVVVISHSVFTNIFVEHLCLDKAMSFVQAVAAFWRVMTLRNTGIIHLEYNKVREGLCSWRIHRR